MLLSIIALVFDEEGDLPRKRVELYERCVQLILEVREHREARITHRLRFTLDQKYLALGKLALHFIQQNTSQFTGEALNSKLVNIEQEINIQHDEINTFIDELCIVGILRRISVLDDTYDFVHKTFMEYFAAREIQENTQKEHYVYKNAKDPNWREVILLYTGLLGDSKELITKLLNQDQVALAGECFLNARIQLEMIREDLITALLAGIKSDDGDKDRMTDVLMGMILPNLEKVINQSEVQNILESRLQDPLERSQTKSAIYKAGLSLEPKLAKKFGERFNLSYVPAGKSIIGVDSPRSYRLSLTEIMLSWIKRQPWETVQYEWLRKEVKLPAYFMDIYPVTNREFRLFIKAGGYKDSKYWCEEGWIYITRQKQKNLDIGKMNSGIIRNILWSGFAGTRQMPTLVG